MSGWKSARATNRKASNARTVQQRFRIGNPSFRAIDRPLHMSLNFIILYLIFKAAAPFVMVTELVVFGPTHGQSNPATGPGSGGGQDRAERSRPDAVSWSLRMTGIGSVPGEPRGSCVSGVSGRTIGHKVVIATAGFRQVPLIRTAQPAGVPQRPVAEVRVSIDCLGAGDTPCSNLSTP